MTQYTRAHVKCHVKKSATGYLQLTLAAQDNARVKAEGLALAVQKLEDQENPSLFFYPVRDTETFAHKMTAGGTRVQYTSREPLMFAALDFTTTSGKECALLVRPTVCGAARTRTPKRSHARAFGEEGAKGAAKEEEAPEGAAKEEEGAKGAAKEEAEGADEEEEGAEGAAKEEAEGAEGADEEEAEGADEEEEEDDYEYLDDDSGGASEDEEEEEAEKADDHPGDVSDNEELADLPKHDGRYADAEGCGYQFLMVDYAKSLRRRSVKAKAQNVRINARNASRDRRRALRQAGAPLIDPMGEDSDAQQQLP